MKKLLCMLLALAMLPALSGCGSIYSNYQQLESLLVIQAMGIDKTPRGGGHHPCLRAEQRARRKSDHTQRRRGIHLSGA